MENRLPHTSRGVKFNCLITLFWLESSCILCNFRKQKEMHDCTFLTSIPDAHSKCVHVFGSVVFKNWFCRRFVICWWTYISIGPRKGQSIRSTFLILSYFSSSAYRSLKLTHEKMGWSKTQCFLGAFLENENRYGLVNYISNRKYFIIFSR